MLTIHLNKLIFKAHHGLYDEEKIIGNEFEVNVIIKQYNALQPIQNIQQTINYVQVYQLVKQIMQQPTDLLETVAQNICNTILDTFFNADEVFCSIIKSAPPIQSFQGNIGISFELRRNNKINTA